MKNKWSNISTCRALNYDYDYGLAMHTHAFHTHTWMDGDDNNIKKILKCHFYFFSEIIMTMKVVNKG